ncbi:M14 family metallopeptidase [Thalassotalea sp. PS06]|uniref:M14 family metallopeptidase n=1 Tax=Thalassotalea sp. PS06 TaxID=2594005 RepID=UPI0011627665|nr:M14 family metallopeptidase [Thalassotalea sp. PS06]QDP02647.1 DUF2817 domain-containing protein [Thalassotalea sp. PS06]
MQIKSSNKHANPYMVLTSLIFILSGCGASMDGQTDTSLLENAQCSDGSTVISKNFATGQFQYCQLNSNGTFLVKLSPESEPINPSPWYAFNVAGTDKQAVVVELDFGTYDYRYWPKISSDRIHWKSLSPKNVEVQSEGRRLQLTISQPGDVYIAAQPVVDNQDYQRWIGQLQSQFSGLMAPSIGKSTSGRPLPSITLVNPQAEHSIVILGRQHPPEVTGALALQSFIETLLSDQVVAKNFREKFNILVLPNLNPDGVDNGFWRLNENFVDLNRDWGPFKQPETSQAIAAIEAFIGDNDMVSMLDFHSTKKNILYTQKDGQSRYPLFADGFHKAINSLLQSTSAPELMARKGSHNPNLNTAKRYFYERYDIPSITVELNDYNTQVTANNLGESIALAYMQQLLSTVQ